MNTLSIEVRKTTKNRSEEKRAIDDAIAAHVKDKAAVLSCPSWYGAEKLTDWIVDRVRGRGKGKPWRSGGVEMSKTGKVGFDAGFHKAVISHYVATATGRPEHCIDVMWEHEKPGDPAIKDTQLTLDEDGLVEFWRGVHAGAAKRIEADNG